MSTENYKPFSERHGYKQPKPIQHESMDDDLRNSLWNVFYECSPDNLSPHGHFLNSIFASIWEEFLKLPIDKYYNHYLNENKIFVKDIFLKSEWHEVFNLMEYVISEFSSSRRQHFFVQKCNQVLKKENSAYQIIDGLVTEITSEQEIESIEIAMATPYHGASNHIKRALRLLSDRENPDYKNSIKESICAVESITKQITDNDSFASGVNELANHDIKLHPAHQTALKNLYGFTSDADGIRHASVKDKSLDINQNTARFMLITCSAFVNYIVAENPKKPKTCD